MTKRICKVLILEDDKGIQEILAEVFGREGYRFTVMARAEEFKATIDDGDIDVAIVDVLFPGPEDGYDLARYAADRGCGVVLVTGHHDHFERVEKSGHLYAFKPYSVRSLLTLIDEALLVARRNCELRKGTAAISEV
jgi:two-component system, OmpR family, response regulator